MSLSKLRALFNERWFLIGLWYSVLSSCGTLHGLLFGMYHLDMFLSVWHLTSMQIASVHLVYMIWNVLNDLVSGYISDWFQHSYPNRSRLALIQPMTILWSFVTLLPFYSFSWLFSGSHTLHYFITISLYDGFFSFICIAKGAMWTDDLTTTQSDRVNLQLIQKPMNAVICSALSFASYYVWDKNDLHRFHLLLWCTVFFSVSATFIACHKLQTYLSKDNIKANTASDVNQPLMADTASSLQSLSEQTKKGLFSLHVFIRQVSSQMNLWLFIGASVVNETQIVFLGQFTSIFTDILLSNWSASTRATYLSLTSFVNTWIGITGLFLVQQEYISVYQLCKASIALKLVVGIVGFMMYMTMQNELIASSAFFCGIFLSVNKLCNAVFVSFFMITVANLCDEQKAFRIRHRLPALASMVSMYWGLHALCAKPFNSLGPIVGTAVLEKYGYNEEQKSLESFDQFDGMKQLDIKNGCFQLMLWFLTVLSVLQFAFWRQYSLQGKQLLEIQKTLKQPTEKHTNDQ